MVRKPIDEISKPNNACGFTKGVGIGCIGLALRPVTGVFDFASQGFEEIRRYNNNPNFLHEYFESFVFVFIVVLVD